MIKIRSGKTWLIGLTAGNFKHMKDGDPMVIRHEETGDITGDIYFIYKDTMEELILEIEDLSGQKLPQYIREGGNA